MPPAETQKQRAGLPPPFNVPAMSARYDPIAAATQERSFG